MQERRTDTRSGRLGLPPMGRRSALATLKWLVVLALLGVLVAIATELIPSGVNSADTEGGAGAAPSRKSSSSESSPPPNGWGPVSTYLGRYHVLDATQRSSGGSVTRLTGGELTMFMREVKKGLPLVPSGILSLNAPAPLGTELLYLTSLTSYGATHEAVVNGGAFVGPVVGSFAAVPTGEGDLTVTATVEGLGSIRAGLRRFSDSPQP